MFDPSEPSRAYRAASDAWQLDADLWGGRETMRDAGERRLPPLPATTPERWRIMRNGARYLPNYPQAVRGTAGRLRESEPHPVESVPELLQDWFWEQDFQSILYLADVDGMRRGASYFVVDVDADGAPMVAHIPAADMLEAWPETGQELQYVRFRRVVTAPEGADPVTWVYRMRTTEGRTEVTVWNDAAGGEFVEVSREEQDGELRAVRLQYSEEPYEPYFRDLAALSEAYWQSSAFQVHSESFARFNLLWGVGLPDEMRIASIGPHALLKLGEGGSLNALEGGGAGIEAGRLDLETLQNQMAQLAARPMRSDGIRTATEVGRDSSQEDAPIRRLADMRLAALREVMRFAAGLLGIAQELENYDVAGENEFEEIVPGNQDAQQLLNALAVGAIDGETFRQGIVRAIPALHGVDPADIADRLEI